MKKIYYIPGIFFIILLPVLGIWYINSHGYFTQLSSIDFTSIDFAEIERMTKKYEHVNYGQNEFENRIYKEVTLSNNNNSKTTFKYIDQFVNDVVQTKDTINGLKIHFEEEATYNEFIEVLNIFTERDAELYILDHNTMYFVGRDWQPIIENDDEEGLPALPLDYFGCELILAGDFNHENSSLKEQFNQNKIIYSSYIIFVLLAILSIYIKNKKLPK